MERWRDLLARNLALRNTLTQRELNFAVQRVLDRVIFLRIAEDRGIEPYGQLLAITAGPKIYPRFGQIFERADFRYNSGLFHFATEKGRDECPDKLTLGLTLGDATLKEIITALYWPKSPYAFAVIPADILGHVYEQFLGKVIHLTSDHRAVVEEKPEVRKAGGVYYTPTYIVRYIVEKTVGPLLAGKSPKQLEHLTVLDPACGSGSFLLGAFEYLLDWYLAYYVAHDPAAWAKKKHPPLYETNSNAGYRSLPPEVERLVPKTPRSAASASTPPARNWQLTTAERKRIFVTHLFVVDIDAQAVEVTKLSLLLKVLEGEARELRGKQLDFHRVLPDLGNNIKCGNSLIGSDFYAQPELPAVDDEARIKPNAFDWPREFKPIMDRGGFDAVIGNPPYIPLEMLSDPEKNYIRDHYPALQRKFDSSVAFVLAFLAKLGRSGKSGYVAPQTGETGENYSDFRRVVLEQFGLCEVINLPFNVFKDAYVDTGIFVFTKEKQPTYSLCVMPKKQAVADLKNTKFEVVATSDLEAPDFRLVRR
ncbi:MAG: N-6 DNA methylase [Undibacterium sp.]|nr:N-6 DNA methylase [Opitutaceae bacterium]